MEASDQVNRVPRSAAEEQVLLATRPDGWEYLLFAAVLFQWREELEPRWRAHEAYDRPDSSDPTLTPRQAIDRMQGVFDEAIQIVDASAGLFVPQVTEPAFGRLGEDGDVEKIRDFASSVMQGCQGLLDWSARLRGEHVPDLFREVFDRASDLANAAIGEYRAFALKCVDDLDALPEALRTGQPVNLSLKLILTVDEGDKQRYEGALRRAEAAAHQKFEDVLATSPQRIAAADPLDALGDASKDGPVGSTIPRSEAGGGFFARRRERKAQAAYDAELATWQATRDGTVRLLSLAQSYGGERSSSIMLKSGEAIFATVSGASLVEDRRMAGQWQGRSSGFSVPVGSLGRRSIRYRVGASRGTFVQGASVATAIDFGTVYVTNRRVIFQGVKQTRECLFDKLVGFQHLENGSTVFSVSNRQKPTNILYGNEVAAWFDFRLDLALAHYRGDVDSLVTQLQRDLETIDAVRPRPPS